MPNEHGEEFYRKGESFPEGSPESGQEPYKDPDPAPKTPSFIRRVGGKAMGMREEETWGESRERWKAEEATKEEGEPTIAPVPGEAIAPTEGVVVEEATNIQHDWEKIKRALGDRKLMGVYRTTIRKVDKLLITPEGYPEALVEMDYLESQLEQTSYAPEEAKWKSESARLAYEKARKEIEPTRKERFTRYGEKTVAATGRAVERGAQAGMKGLGSGAAGAVKMSMPGVVLPRRRKDLSFYQVGGKVERSDLYIPSSVKGGMTGGPTIPMSAYTGESLAKPGFSGKAPSPIAARPGVLSTAISPETVAVSMPKEMVLPGHWSVPMKETFTEIKENHDKDTVVNVQEKLETRKGIPKYETSKAIRQLKSEGAIKVVGQLGEEDQVLVITKRT